jgi:hypothetical protein
LEAVVAAEGKDTVDIAALGVILLAVKGDMPAMSRTVEINGRWSSSISRSMVRWAWSTAATRSPSVLSDRRRKLSRTSVT